VRTVYRRLSCPKRWAPAARARGATRRGAPLAVGARFAARNVRRSTCSHRTSGRRFDKIPTDLVVAAALEKTGRTISSRGAARG
jgi:hypothetical protein